MLLVKILSSFVFSVHKKVENEIFVLLEKDCFLIYKEKVKKNVK